MSVERQALLDSVVPIVADALAVPVDRVQPYSSLIDDLGAESIDFLDILFRLEAAFSIEIPEEDLWRGSFEGADAAAIEAGVQRLRARMPEFRWDRLPASIGREDLPRLITVQTIVDYLERRPVVVPKEDNPQP